MNSTPRLNRAGLAELARACFPDNPGPVPFGVLVESVCQIRGVFPPAGGRSVYRMRRAGLVGWCPDGFYLEPAPPTSPGRRRRTKQQ
jgi:hypothetical protein